MFACQGAASRFGGNIPRPPKGTLTPFIPLSLRACKGEGERRTEADVGALHPRLPLVQYWGGGDSGSGMGMMGESGMQGTHKGHPYREGEGAGKEPSPPWSPSLRAFKGEGDKKQRQRLALQRQPLPLVWYWGDGPRPRFLAGHRNDRGVRGWALEATYIQACRVCPMPL